jgi:hypothetical protein
VTNRESSYDKETETSRCLCCSKCNFPKFCVQVINFANITLASCVFYYIYRLLIVNSWHYFSMGRRDSSVGLATELRAGQPRLDSRQGLRVFLFTTAPGPALGPTQPPIQWVPAALSQGVKRPCRKADHSSRLAPRLRMREATPPFPHTSLWRGS